MRREAARMNRLLLKKENGMKRRSINVDLKENELFDKMIQELIRAKVKEVVRNEYGTHLQNAVAQEFKRLLDANTYGYRDKLNETVKGCAVTGVREALESMDIPELIQGMATEVMDEKMKYYLQDADRIYKAAFDSIATKQAEEQVKKILG